MSDRGKLLGYIKDKLHDYTEGFKNTVRLDDLYKQFEVKDWAELSELEFDRLSAIAQDL